MLTHRVSVIVGLATVAIIGFAMAQAPIPVEEQVRLFNSMAPAQQQALIRELQRNLPPAQLEAVLRVLQGDGKVGEAAAGESPKPATSAPEEAPAETPSEN